MKTPITEALENHKELMDATNQNETAYWYLNKLIDDLNAQLPKEREQIEEATRDCVVFGYRTYEQPLSTDTIESLNREVQLYMKS